MPPKEFLFKVTHVTKHGETTYCPKYSASTREGAERMLRERFGPDATIEFLKEI